MDFIKRASIANSTKTASHSSLHRSKRRTRWIIRGVVIFLSVAICIQQSYLVFDLYFRYPTNVDIRLDQSPFIHLPSVTICSELPATILVEDLARVAPSVAAIFGGRFSKPEVKRLLGKKAVREKLLAVLQSMPLNLQHRFTVSASNFFYECALPTPVSRESGSAAQKSTTAITCEQFTPIIETINIRYKCFSLFLNRSSAFLSQKPLRKNYRLSKGLVSHLKYLVWMGIRREYIFNGFLYVHSPHMSHQFSNPKAVQHLDPNRHQSLTFAFEREIIQLLPPPYETNCRDYRSISLSRRSYQCREHCLSECKVRRYLALDGGWPGDIYAEANITAHFSPTWSNVFSSAGHLEEGGLKYLESPPNTEKQKGKELCTEDCGAGEDDCERVLYDVRTVRVRERDLEADEQAEQFNIGILPPQEVQLVIQHVPKFAFIEFVIYVGGLVNLYLGFSAISLGVLLATYCTCSTKLQTKHFCLPVRRARTRALKRSLKTEGKSGSGKRLLASILIRSKRRKSTSETVNGNGQVTLSSAASSLSTSNGNNFTHNYVPLSNGKVKVEEEEEDQDVSINL